jgi:uncharacterized protein YdhG (YjbR/CyaY superfamily)
MVQSNAVHVGEYLAEVPEDRRAALAELRAMCLEELAGFVETMLYGMPCYLREGTAEVALACQKQYISIHIMRPDVRDAHAGRLAGQNMGKGCLRYRKPEQIDFDLVRSMLKATAASSGPVC